MDSAGQTEHAMSDSSRTKGPLSKKLESIHERMKGVSEEEVQVALSDTRTVGATTAKTLTAWVERRARIESASTQTA